MRTATGRHLRALLVGLLVLGTSMVGGPTFAEGPGDGADSTETTAVGDPSPGTEAADGVTDATLPPTDSSTSDATERTSNDRSVATTTISVPNPDLQAACGTDVVLVLDESGSIDSANAVTQVSAAVKALATGLSNTGSRLRIVEFTTNARNAVVNGSADLQVVDATYLAGLDVYLRYGADTNNGIHPGNPSSYNPHEGDSDHEYFTNWEAGLSNALPGAPLVVFITDGEPNTIGTAGNSVGGSQTAWTAAMAAINEVNSIKTATPTQHMLGIGVGNAMSSSTSFNRLRDLIEPTNPIVWTGTGTLDLRTTDAIKVAEFSGLDDALRRVVFGLCAPSLSVTKVNDAGEVVGNFPITATVDVENTGAGSQRQVDWVKPDDGVTAAPTTKTVATGASGTPALFQWTPNTRFDPQAWDSTVSFTEVLPVGWTPGWSSVDPPMCSVQRLNSDGSISDFDVALTWSPTNPVGGDTVRFSVPGKVQAADIVTCTIQNNRIPNPATLVIVKTTTNGVGGPFTFPITPAVGDVSSIELSTSIEANPATATLTGLIPGTQYTLGAEQMDAAAWTAGVLTCVRNGDPTPIGTTFTPNPGDTITCSITNAKHGEAAISVAKTDSVDIPVLRDQAFDYTIVVTNNGPSAVSNVTITDDLPDGLIFLGASGTNWTCSPTDPLTCEYAGGLPAGASAEVLTIKVKVAGDYAGPTFHNVAVAQALVDGDLVSANDDENTPFTTIADLAIVKTVSDDNPDAGSTFTWTLTVTNHGPNTAESVVVSDVVPDRVNLVSVTSAQFSCSSVGNLVTCTKASMAAGETGTIAIVVSVPADLPGQSIENVGVVSSSTSDSNPANNTSASMVLTDVSAVSAEVPVIPEEIAPLPATGSDVNSLLVVGMAAILMGGALVIAGRRGRHNI